MYYEGIYHNGDIKIGTVLCDETLWLTQASMTELYGVQRPAITKNLKSIFSSGELFELMVSSILEHAAAHGAIEGKRQT
jgi:hypothetical protein